MRRIASILTLLLVLVPITWAQVNVYTCDFESEAERSQWILNQAKDIPTTNALNDWWFMGEAGHFAPTGEYGLFISDREDGITPSYDGDKTIFVTAQRIMADMPAGEYDIYFDWRAMCKGVTEGFYVCWVPLDQRTYSAKGVAGLPQWAIDYRLNELPFSQSSIWSPGKVTMQHDGTPHKLVFLWFGTKGTVVMPSPCIDNIQISRTNSCEAVTNLRHSISMDTVVLSWDGNADWYEVRSCDLETGQWHILNHVSATTCMITNVMEGVQSFTVRPHCGDSAGDYSQYTQLVYHKGNRCIDYMELTGGLRGNCYTGPYANPAAVREKVDFGYASPASRHTLHYMPNEYDERSDFKLKTKPDGYLASVRLGNYDSGNGTGEAVTYTYRVTSNDNAILKIKYAAVLSNPHPEKPEINPQFWLDVYHNGHKIDHDCGHAAFTAGDSEASGWQEGAPGWLYKPWTEQAINLRDFVGETLTIQLVTTDCEPGAHTGYAYFVLDCEAGEMSDLNCGEDNPTTTFRAPDGFNYVWYLPDQPRDTLSKDQTFVIAPMDTLTYNVNIINKNNKNCWYTLDVCGMPRIPVPEASYSVTAVRCQNVVTFENESYVKYKNLVTNRYQRSDERVTSLYWDFGDGSPVIQSRDSVVKHVYPATGGTFTMRLSAGISNDACVETKEIVLDLPDLQIPITNERAHACREDYPFGYRYAGIRFKHNTDTMITLISAVNGCDSIVHFQLQWSDTTAHPIHAAICEGGSYNFNGRILTEAGEYDTTYPDAYDCDSLVHLTLETVPVIRVHIPDTFVICADDRIMHIEVIGEEEQSSRYTEMQVHFDARSQSKGMQATYSFQQDEIAVIRIPDQVDPTILNAHVTFIPSDCSLSDKDIRVELRYATSIFKEKNGMLAVMNDQFNGGYFFDSFQWYRDDQPIAGATMSVLSVNNNDLGHAFNVELTRTNDPEKVATRACSIIYTHGQENVAARETSAGPYTVYTTTGRLIGQWEKTENISGLDKGIYVVRDTQNNVYKIFY